VKYRSFAHGLVSDDHSVGNNGLLHAVIPAASPDEKTCLEKPVLECTVGKATSAGGEIFRHLPDKKGLHTILWHLAFEGLFIGETPGKDAGNCFENEYYGEMVWKGAVSTSRYQFPDVGTAAEM
jgi:hypothetical protein